MGGRDGRQVHLGPPDDARWYDYEGLASWHFNP